MSLPPILRGMTSAMGLLGAAAGGLIPYSAMEITALVHATIVGWNVLVGGIWGVIAGVLNLPDFPPQLISAAVFGSSISIARAYGVFLSERGTHQKWIDKINFWIRVCISFVQGPIFAVFVFTAYPETLFWVALVPLFVILMYVLFLLPKFRAGFLTVLAFLALLEVIYMLSTDPVRHAIDSFICDTQNVGLPQC